MHIDRKTRQQLIDALTPHVQSVEERHAILGAALYDTTLLGLIPLEGAARNFATRLIIEALRYGAIDSGEPAILPVLYEIRMRVGGSNAQAIEALMQQVQQAPSEAPDHDAPNSRIFLSYRRANSTFIGRSVFQDLRAAGYDVFFDVEGLDSGNFPQMILRQIEARPHFVIILAPGSLDRSVNPDDWLRREIEHAIDTERNIIPLLFNGFEFSDYAHILTGKLSGLQHANAVRVPTEPEYFEDAMRRLRGFLQTSRSIDTATLPQADEPGVTDQVTLAAAVAEPTEEELEREAELQRREQQLNTMQRQLQQQANEQQGSLQEIEQLRAELDQRWAMLEVLERDQGAAKVQKTVQVAPPASPSAAVQPPTTGYTSAYDLMPPPFGWVGIPAGQVTLKAAFTDPNPQDYKPNHVAKCTLAKYPITNAQFAKFVEAGGYKQKAWWTEDGWAHRQVEGWTVPLYWNNDQWNGAEQPVVGVSWHEAIAFCLWLSDASGERIMLPTEQEWQRAAQGNDERTYPWGNDWDRRRCNNDVGWPINFLRSSKVEGQGGRTTPVTAYEKRGRSPFGVVDMAGNVWEWCLKRKGDSEPVKHPGNYGVVARGGAYFEVAADKFRCDSRLDHGPAHRDNKFGFRIARSDG